jgi:amino acid transporter
MTMTDDMTVAKPKGFNTSYDNAPDMEPGVEASGTMEEIRRDMKSRHINMIAIAGMIVRTPHPSMRVSAE